MASDAAMVGTSLKSALKLFLHGRKIDRRVLAGDLDQVVGLITCERGLFGHSAKPAAAAAGIDARDTRFRLRSVRKSGTMLGQGPGGCDKT